MTRERTTQSVQTPEETNVNAMNAEPESRLEDIGGSGAETVTEIKDTVTDKYGSVKESITEAIDWREQYRRRPITWSVGALSLGALAGYTLAGNYKNIPAFNRLQKELARLGDRLVEGVADVGDRFVDTLTDTGHHLVDHLPSVAGSVVPALAGVAVPIVTNQIKEAVGGAISDAPPGQSTEQRKDRAGKGKKKNGAKKKKDKKQPEVDAS